MGGQAPPRRLRSTSSIRACPRSIAWRGHARIKAIESSKAPAALCPPYSWRIDNPPHHGAHFPRVDTTRCLRSHRGMVNVSSRSRLPLPERTRQQRKRLTSFLRSSRGRIHARFSRCEGWRLDPPCPGRRGAPFGARLRPGQLARSSRRESGGVLGRVTVSDAIHDAVGEGNPIESLSKTPILDQVLDLLHLPQPARQLAIEVLD